MSRVVAAVSELDTGEHPVLLFDGVCNLCNGTIQYVIERDPAGIFRFAPLQSDVGTRLLEECGLPSDQLETFVLVEDGACYTKSEAVLRVTKRLGLPHSVLSGFLVVPRPIRDRVYDFVASHRYQWFGKRDSCMMPSEDITERFLVQSEESPSD